MVRRATFAVLLLLAACADQSKLREADLVQLATWLPGIYDNHEQVDAERAQGRTTHEAVTLWVIPVDAPMFGDAVFYLHETAGDDLRRVLTQRIVSFAIAKDSITETTWTFAEPARWREGQRDPDLFKAMLPQDLKEAAGCAMTWVKAGDRFKGTNDAKTCRTASGATAELGPENLLLDQRGTISSASALEGSDAAGVFRFRKRASRQSP